MVLNRRKMLQASIGAIALGLSGCKKGKITTIVFANGTTKIISKINAFAAGQEYLWAKPVAPGAYSQQGDFPTDKKADGQLAPLTGKITFKSGHPPIDLAGQKLKVTLGRTNTFTVGKTFKVTVTVSNS